MLKPRFGFGENGEIVDNGKPDYSHVEDIKPVERDMDYDIADIDFSKSEVDLKSPLGRFKKNMEKIKNKHKPQSTAESLEDLDFSSIEPIEKEKDEIDLYFDGISKSMEDKPTKNSILDELREDSSPSSTKIEKVGKKPSKPKI